MSAAAGGGADGGVVVGGRVRWEGREWTVAGLSGGQVWLVAADGATAVVLVSLLFAAPDFEVVGGVPAPRVAPWGLLETLPGAVRERALAWERHVREVETGLPDGPGQAAAVRPEYDPARRTLAQREEAKAAELSGVGMPTSVVTVRRMRARYRRQGVWGLVDGRAKRSHGGGQADERVVAALEEVLEAGRERSDGTLERLRMYTGRLLEQRYGLGEVVLPSVSVFNRLVRVLAQERGVQGSARQRRWRAARPVAPFRPVGVRAPGEVVMMDSTVLDAFVVLDDGVVERPELTIALDVATRSICAAVLRPRGTRSVDAAELLGQMMVPAPMRPGWPATLALQHSVVPYERLLSVDGRLAGAAARPVIVPQTVVVDQGRVFVSSSFVAACARLGISVQPAPPGAPAAKGQVERTFSSINTLFVQHVAGYTGAYVGVRGRGAQGEAVWTLAQLAELFQEWVICGWQVRAHDGLRHPMMPARALSPNEMWAALVAVCGYVPVPLGREDYIELMPLKRQKINDYGIRIGYRTYDHRALNAYRGRRSAAADGLWEIHYDPHDAGRVWVRLPHPGQDADYTWQDVPWIHQGLVEGPFTDFAWQHVRQVVARQADRVRHEHDLALALRDLLERAAAGHGSRREKTVAARARARGQAGGPRSQLLSAAPSDSAPGLDAGPEEDGDHGDLEAAGGPSASGPGEANAEREPREQAAGELVRVYDPVEESLRW
ncbi:transposase [Streptomyces sp. NPDC094149]|uniref:transposase n=1 Tax=Streptomyces sp. NPDC094149 TaxID=3155079 RepID=UPI00331CA854